LDLTQRESAQELPIARLLVILATFAKVPTVLDRLDRIFVKQSMKPRLDHSPNHFVNWPLASLIGIVRIPLSPPVFFEIFRCTRHSLRNSKSGAKQVN
jgi:hypothetical protein